jgi:transcriptional regulator with XRE-family HTH domain
MPPSSECVDCAVELGCVRLTKEVSMPSVKTRRKRKLGKFLLDLREVSRLEQPEVARRLRKSSATVSKIENGHVSPDFPTLTALLLIYGATDDQRQKAEDLWEDARQDSVRVEYSSAMPPKYMAFLRAEAEAASVRTLEQTVVPGLLQTPDYTKSVDIPANRFIPTRQDAERAASSRLRRQERLYDDDPLTLLVLMDEAVIRRTIGGTVVMREQLRHLLDIGELPTVAIRVIPFGAGEYGVMTGSVTILGFAEPDEPDQVYLESPSSGQLVDNADDVRKFVDVFEETVALALPIEESAALIRAEADAL